MKRYLSINENRPYWHDKKGEINPNVSKGMDRIKQKLLAEPITKIFISARDRDKASKILDRNKILYKLNKFTQFDYEIFFFGWDSLYKSEKKASEACQKAIMLLNKAKIEVDWYGKED